MLSKVEVLNQGERFCELMINGNMYLISYAKTVVCVYNGKTYLDEKYHDFSVTTVRHRNNFLGRGSKEVKKLIEDGTYVLANLN